MVPSEKLPPVLEKRGTKAKLAECKKIAHEMTQLLVEGTQSLDFDESGNLDLAHFIAWRKKVYEYLGLENEIEEEGA
jgi:hypothetical protein